MFGFIYSMFAPSRKIRFDDKRLKKNKSFNQNNIYTNRNKSIMYIDNDNSQKKIQQLYNYLKYKKSLKKYFPLIYRDGDKYANEITYGMTLYDFIIANERNINNFYENNNNELNNIHYYNKSRTFPLVANNLIHMIHHLNSNGFFHNNLHPGNIIVTNYKTFALKIIDFDKIFISEGTQKNYVNNYKNRMKNNKNSIPYPDIAYFYEDFKKFFDVLELSKQRLKKSDIRYFEKFHTYLNEVVDDSNNLSHI